MTTERLTTMNDLQVVRFFEHWGTSLCDGAMTDLETITAGVSEEVRVAPGFDYVTDLSVDRNLDPGDPPRWRGRYCCHSQTIRRLDPRSKQR